MAMPFAIELALDRESAGPVRRLWRRMAEAGIRFMADSGADPHVSLAIWNSLNVEAAIAEVAALAPAIAPVPVTFTAVRAFGRDVVYLALAPSTRLVELQARVQARIGARGDGAWPHYAPAAWVPHCTLAMDLGPVTLETALGVAAGFTLPLHSRLDRMGVVEFRPVRERYSQPLTGR
jgi:2'-5' RNA ligase